MTDESINKIVGEKLSEALGGIYEEVKHLREGVLATYIKGNQDEFTEEEITWALSKKDELIAFNRNILLIKEQIKDKVVALVEQENLSKINRIIEIVQQKTLEDIQYIYPLIRNNETQLNIYKSQKIDYLMKGHHTEEEAIIFIESVIDSIPEPIVEEPVVDEYDPAVNDPDNIVDEPIDEVDP